MIDDDADALRIKPKSPTPYLRLERSRAEGAHLFDAVARLIYSVVL